MHRLVEFCVSCTYGWDQVDKLSSNQLTDYADTSLSIKRFVPRAYFSSQQPVKTALLLSAELSQQFNMVVDTVSMDIVKLYTQLPSFQEESFYIFSSSSVLFLFGAIVIWSK